MSRAVQTTHPHAAGTSHGLSIPSVTFRDLSFKYHSVPAESLVKRTVNRLTECGISKTVLGRFVGKRITLTGCVALDPQALATLPPALGGSAEFFHASPATSTLLERAVACSPLRGASLGRPPRAPSPWRTPVAGRQSPPEARLPSSAERIRLLDDARDAAVALAAAERHEHDALGALLASEDAAVRQKQEEARAKEALVALRRSTLRSGAGVAPAAGAPEPAPAASRDEFADAFDDAPDVAQEGPPVAARPSGLSVPDDVPFLTAGLAAALEAAAAPADGVAAAGAAYRAASAQRAARADADHRARRRLADLDSVFSATASGSASLSSKEAQVHVAAASQNIAQCASIVSDLAAHAAEYPLTMRALRAKCTASERDLDPADPSDFGILVLVPALSALRAQEWGLRVLRKGASDEASLAGLAGTAAVKDFSPAQFDYVASTAISRGRVDVDVSPLDIALGVLPLAQLALHVWFARHTFRPGGPSKLLEAAQTLSFKGPDGATLLPEHGLQQTFRTEWADALRSDADVPVADVYHALCKTLKREALLPGGESVSIVIDGAPITWTAFARQSARRWHEEFSGGLDGASRRAPTMRDLTDLVGHLDTFGEACVVASGPDELRPPTSGSYNVALLQAPAVLPAPPPAVLPAPPPTVLPAPPAFLVAANSSTPPPWHTHARGRGGGRGAGRGAWPRRGGRGAPSAATAGAAAPTTATPAMPIKLRTSVIASAQNVLSISPLIRQGWSLHVTSTVSETGFRIPGVPTICPARRDVRGNYYVDLVPHELGLSLYDPRDPSHRSARRVPFLIDTGAEMSLIGPESLALLSQLNIHPIIPITGFSGAASIPVATGNLVIVPPPGATAPTAPVAAEAGVTYEHASVFRVMAHVAPGHTLPAATDTSVLDELHDLLAGLHEQRCLPSAAVSDSCDALVRQGAARHGFELAATTPPPLEAPTSHELEALTAERAADSADALRAVALAVRSVRATAFPPTRRAHVAADRWNCTNTRSLKALLSACPLGMHPDLLTGVPPDTDFTFGLAAGLLKAPPIHHARAEIPATIRDTMPPGHVWWTDNSNLRPPDWEGNTYSRLFSEERTHTVATFYASRKDSATLIDQLDRMRVWISQHVPGGALSVLRCDFASEAVRQGHGDEVYTRAMSEYCDQHPGFRLIAVPPHSQAFNRAENDWGRIHGHSFLCARRARLGHEAWSLVERGAVYIHNHTPAPHAVDDASHHCSRWEALTLMPTDMSTMLGYVGQLGYTHRTDGKANQYRARADPVLYICPSESLHAQVVFNLVSFKLMIVASLSISPDPTACAYALAGSHLYRPAGLAGEPPDDAYASRLNALLAWRPLASDDLDTSIVRHDPIDGLPMEVITLRPCIASDGSLIMLDPREGLDEPAELATSTLAAPVDGLAVPATLTLAAPDAAPTPSPTATTPPPHVPPWTPIYNHLSSAQTAAAIKCATDGGDSWEVRWHGNDSKTGKSGVRFEAYRGAKTFGEFKRLHALHAGNVSWRDDLRNDLRVGKAAIRPRAQPPPRRADHAHVARAAAARSPQPALMRARHRTDKGAHRRLSRTPSPTASTERPVVDSYEAGIEIPGPASWPAVRASMELIEAHAAALIRGDPPPSIRVRTVHVGPARTVSYVAELAELTRIDGLEPSPLPGTAHIGPVTEPSPAPDVRQVPAYTAGVQVLRAALLDDYSPTVASDDADDLAPATAPILAAVEPHLAFMAAPEPDAPVAPKSVAAARQLPDFGAPNGWKAQLS